MPVFSNHPLANPDEVKRMLAELPGDDSFRYLETLASWLRHLLTASEVEVQTLVHVASLIDEAAQAHLRRLTRVYLQSPRLAKTEEARLYVVTQGYLKPLTDLYERLQDMAYRQNRLSEALRALLAARLLANLGTMLKWENFRYAPNQSNLWLRLGYTYLLAESGGYGHIQVELYPAHPVPTNPAKEYLRVLVLQSSSLDCLLPIEMEWTDQLLGLFLPYFSLTARPEPGSIYWIDASRPIPPVRLAQQPMEISASLRFFCSGSTYEQLLVVRGMLEQGSEVPPQLRLDGNPSPRVLLRLIRHLVACWSPTPPQRQHQRYKVRHRTTILHGLVNIFKVFSGHPLPHDEHGEGVNRESWVVQNVSQGGFGAIITHLKGDWIRLGCLIALQPSGGDNWLLCTIRRYHRYSDIGAAVGIQTLGRKISTVDLFPHQPGENRPSHPALCIHDGNEPGEVRLIIPPGGFRARQTLVMEGGAQKALLTPVLLINREPEYEIARYRVRWL